MAAAASPASAGGDLLVVVLCNGLDATGLTEVLNGLKSESKKIGSHKRRELFWEAYGALISKAGSLQGSVNAMLLCRAVPDGGNTAEVVDLTKRQRGLIGGGGVEILGRKLRPQVDPVTKSWAMAWSEKEAQPALDDLLHGEPCIYVTTDTVFVSTRLKRVMCQSQSGSLKTVKEIEKLRSELSPDKPLRSVAFAGHEPPSINGYNFILAGTPNPGDLLPKTVGYINSISANEIYDYFLLRRNDHLVGEAEKLIAQMLSDVGKGVLPLISASSKKDAAVAYKNGLMKRVFVHESMAKFVNRVQQDGQVEISVIRGNVDGTLFAQYGSIVFEQYYRVDLHTFS
eukprot:m.74667 g.74667  ORF g.74667 m.74667 type:complete len:342 (-) comp18910_c0_seq2:101-1126(-)